MRRWLSDALWFLLLVALVAGGVGDYHLRGRFRRYVPLVQGFLRTAQRGDSTLLFTIADTEPARRMLDVGRQSPAEVAALLTSLQLESGSFSGPDTVVVSFMTRSPLCDSVVRSGRVEFQVRLARQGVVWHVVYAGGVC